MGMMINGDDDDRRMAMSRTDNDDQPNVLVDQGILTIRTMIDQSRSLTNRSWTDHASKELGDRWTINKKNARGRGVGY